MRIDPFPPSSQDGPVSYIKCYLCDREVFEPIYPRGTAGPPLHHRCHKNLIAHVAARGKVCLTPQERREREVLTFYDGGSCMQG